MNRPLRMRADNIEMRYINPILSALPTWSLLRQFKILIWLQIRFKAAEKFSLRWWLWGLPYLVFGVPFVIQDVIYNFTTGSYIFLEWPRRDGEINEWEWIFTQRLKRMDREKTLPGCMIRFKEVLNIIDPGHV